MTPGQFKKLALSFPEAMEAPHFEKTSFRVRKKIFATLDEKMKNAVIKLDESGQDIFHIASKGSIRPIENKWGKQGWTIVDLKSVNTEVLKDALRTSYCLVAPKKLTESI